MLNDFPKLITTRTIEDIEYANYLLERWKEDESQITPEEREEFFNGLRGKYTYVDLNRVQDAVKILAKLLNDSLYPVEELAFRKWEIPDVPRPEDMETYLANINALKRAFFIFHNIPTLPESMENLGYEGANNIEEVLFNMHVLLTSQREFTWNFGEAGGTF